MKKIAVIGAGAWGTTLTKIISENKFNVSLWSFEKKVAENIINGNNNDYLPNVKLPNITVSQDIETVIKDSKIVIFAVPSQYFKQIVIKAKPHIKHNMIIVSATKGFSPDGLTMSQILLKELAIDQNNILVVSGPNIAKEIANKIPSSTVIGYNNKKNAVMLQTSLMTDHLRVYICDDLIGVELGGCLKNIIAIASGICDGLGLGANTKASLLTRGLTEITRLGVELGAKPYTFAGLSGMGDLIATSMSPLSRNRTFGEKIAGGKKRDEIISNQLQVVEGVYTTKAALKIAEELDIPMPITTQIAEILFNNKQPSQALKDLMMRSPKEEVY